MQAGYPIDAENANDGERDAGRRILPRTKQLKQPVAELTERLIVLERIATDPAERVSREIEKLR